MKAAAADTARTEETAPPIKATAMEEAGKAATAMAAAETATETMYNK